MPAAKGAALTLEALTTAPSTYTAIAGLRTRSFTQNREQVDVTHGDHTNLHRRLLDAGGVYQLSVSGSGIFEDDLAYAFIEPKVRDGASFTARLTLPGYGTYTGLFVCTSLEANGEYNGAVQFSMTLESAGTITFTAAA